MLLAIDIGNTDFTIGVFQGKLMCDTFRMRTKINRTSDVYGVFIFFTFLFFSVIFTIDLLDNFVFVHLFFFFIKLI